MRRTRASRTTLLTLLLGPVLLAILSWHVLRTATDEPDARERPARPARPTGPTSPPPRPTAAAPGPSLRSVADPEPEPFPHGISMPLAGVDPLTLRDEFSQTRSDGTRPHAAIDILAPRGTPVFAAGDGVVRKLFTSLPGGLTVYQFDLEERYCFYYAHLDGYAPGLREGQRLCRGDLVGYVGTTGNAPKETPHLHFAVSRLGAEKTWWTGTPIDPFPFLVRAP